MQYKLTASMMCANYGNLEKEVRDLETRDPRLCDGPGARGERKRQDPSRPSRGHLHPAFHKRLSEAFRRARRLLLPPLPPRSRKRGHILPQGAFGRETRLLLRPQGTWARIG